MFGVGNRPVIVGGRQAYVAHRGVVYGVEMVRGTVAQEIAAQQVHAFVEPGEFFHRIRNRPEASSTYPTGSEAAGLALPPPTAEA